MRISQKRLEANRRNAQKSTGPKTEAGKAASRSNATTHGLTSQATTIYRPVRNENPDDFAALRAALITDFNPQGTPELLAVEMMAAAYKRIQRAEAWEAAYFDGAMDALQIQAFPDKPTRSTVANDDLGCGIVLGKPEHQLTWEKLDRYRRSAWLDYNRALEQLRRLQKDRGIAEKEAEKRAARETTPAASTKMGSFRPAPVNAANNTPEPLNRDVTNNSKRPDEPPKAA